MKPLNSGHLGVLKNLSVIERCPLLGGNLKKTVTFGTDCFVRYSRHVRYLGCLLLGSFTVIRTRQRRLAYMHYKLIKEVINLVKLLDKNDIKKEHTDAGIFTFTVT